MLKIKGFKKSIISVLLVIMLLLCACTNESNTNSNENSNSNQNQTQGEVLKPDTSKGETLEQVKGDHIDDDNNGRCDKCNESVLFYIDLFAVNDLHGKITDGSNQPGVDELTSYFKLMYEKEDNVVVLSTGDMWQGSSESNLTKGNLTTEWMNYVGFIKYG